MTVINQNFSMFAGNSKEITVPVDDGINLTGASIEFVVKKSVDSSSVLLRKTDVNIWGNSITILLKPVETQGFSDTCYYECVLTDQYDDVTTLITGTITFNKGGGNITAQQVFMTAMGLMDEESEDGTYEGYPLEYRKKAWRILTLLQSELSSASVVPSVVTDETSIFYLDDRTCLMVLPYGLAAQLLINEDQNRAAFFNARYDELKRKRPATITKIKDVYGVASGEATGNVQSSGINDESWDGGEF